MTGGGADRDRSLTPGAQLTLFCDPPCLDTDTVAAVAGGKVARVGLRSAGAVSVPVSVPAPAQVSSPAGAQWPVASGHTELPEQRRLSTLAVLTPGEPEEWIRTEINLP